MDFVPQPMAPTILRGVPSSYTNEYSSIRKVGIRFALYNDTIFFLYQGLYFLDKENIWNEVQLIPFPAKKWHGQSMTSTSHGLVFFGGESLYRYKNICHNNLYIYKNDSWSFISINSPPRCDHAAAFDGNQSLIVSGGRNEDVIYNDFLLIDLVTGVVTSIEFPNPFSLFNHSIVNLTDNTFIISGGCPSLGHFNEDLYVVDLNSKTISKPYAEDMTMSHPIACHMSLYFSGLLIVAGGLCGGRASRHAWIFITSQSLWIPLDLGSLDIAPIFCYIKNQSMIIIDSSLTNSTELPLTINFDSQVPLSPSDLTGFLKNQISSAISYYHTSPPMENSERISKDHKLEEYRQKQVDLVQSFPESPTKDSILNALKSAMQTKEANEFIARTDNIRKLFNMTKFEKMSSGDESEVSLVHKAHLEILSIFEADRYEESEESDLADELARELSSLTFEAQLQNIIKKSHSDSSDHIHQYESKYLASNHLSEAIKLTQKHLDEEMKQYRILSKKKENLTDDEMRIIDDIVRVDIEKRSNRTNTLLMKQKFLNSSLIEIENRHKELLLPRSYENERNIVDITKYVIENEKFDHFLAVKKDIINQIRQSVDKHDPELIKLNINKLKRWCDDAEEMIDPKQSERIQEKGDRRSRRKKVSLVDNNFFTTKGSQDTFFIKVNEIFKIFEDENAKRMPKRYVKTHSEPSIKIKYH